MSYRSIAMVTIPLGLALMSVSGYLSSHPMGPARTEAIDQTRAADTSAWMFPYHPVTPALNRAPSSLHHAPVG